MGKHFGNEYDEALWDDLTEDRALAYIFTVGMAFLAAEALSLLLAGILW